MTRPLQHTSTLSLSTLLAGLALACSAQASEPNVTPYRPGMGSPAVLSAPSHFEIEAGLEHRELDAGDENELGVLLKYGIDENWGVMLGFSPWLRVASEGAAPVTGASDLMLGIKTVRRIDDGLAIGGQWFATLPTGTRAFRADGVDHTATLLVGIDLGDWHTDLNLGATRHAGNPGAGLGKTEWQWSAAVSHPLSDRISAGFELSGTQQSGAEDTGLAILALSYAASRTFALDVYVGRDWNVEAPGWRIGAGFTYLFGK